MKILENKTLKFGSKIKLTKLKKKVFDIFIINNNNKHKHLPQFFYNDELNDDGNFQSSFPLKHIDRNQYLIREDLMNIYKTDVTEQIGVINDHLLLCDYIVGASKWRSKEYVRYRLKQRKYNHHMGFGFLAKSTEFYFKVFD